MTSSALSVLNNPTTYLFIFFYKSTFMFMMMYVPQICDVAAGCGDVSSSQEVSFSDVSFLFLLCLWSSTSNEYESWQLKYEFHRCSRWPLQERQAKYLDRSKYNKIDLLQLPLSPALENQCHQRKENLNQEGLTFSWRLASFLVCSLHPTSSGHSDKMVGQNDRVRFCFYGKYCLLIPYSFLILRNRSMYLLVNSIY